MNRISSQPGRHILDGALRVFLAELLLPVTGILTAAFLSRNLGPEGYGQFTLAATLVTWVEWNLASLFSRATIKFVAESSDWRPVGAMVLRLHVFTGCGVAAVLWLLAPPISSLLKEPALALALTLFALDIPLWAMARAHQSILIGLGGFKQRAMMSVGRWTTRLLLIILLVGLGLSVTGAVLGTVGASVIELAIGRWYVRPSWWSRLNDPPQRLWAYSVPLFLSAFALSCFDRLDLYALKALGATTAQAGYFAAAQNVSLIFIVLAGSCSPLLISTLTNVFRTGNGVQAREIGVNALRVIVGLLPVICLIAGAAPEIVNVIFGVEFMPATPILSVLIFASWALVIIAVAAAILTAAEKPGWTMWVAGPLVPLALAGHLLIIPRWGGLGAAWVTTGVASVGALAAVLAVRQIWRSLPLAGTLSRSVLIGGLAYAAAILWPAPGFEVLLKLLVVGSGIPLAFYALGEFAPSEVTFVCSLVGWRAVPRQAPRGV